MENRINNLDSFLEENDFDFDDVQETEEVDIPESADKKQESDSLDSETPEAETKGTASKEAPKKAKQSDLTTENMDVDPFDAAFKKFEKGSNEKMLGPLAEKNPIFAYAKVEEEITDTDITFDELRIKYETDFPELSESKKVSWTVTYGKTTKTVSNPMTDKISEIKSEIEKAKSFIENIKKGKTDAEKAPVCYIKPKVTAQTKGDAITSSYKGFYADYNEALQSGKLIAFVPSKDGKIHEIRNNDIGIFATPTREIAEFSDVKAGFIMKLPKIPMEMLFQIINFFRAVSRKAPLEALIHILYDKVKERYFVTVPEQSITAVSVNSDLPEYPENIIHVMDIHSHNDMKAVFSETDNSDEKFTRLYGVIGRIHKNLPEISFRASNAGKFIPVQLEEIFDYDAYYPEDWMDGINHVIAEALCELELHKKVMI